MALAQRRRSSCGYCTALTGDLRHRECPGTLPHASAGKPWTCWCSENGHPDVIPPAPKLEATEDAPNGPETTPGPAEPVSEGKPEPKPTKVPRAGTAERCGHPTGRGPCKRVAGHTRGHDGR